MKKQRTFFITLLCCFNICFVNAQDDVNAETGLPKTLHTIIDKNLDDQFAEIEKALIIMEHIEPRDVVLITVPLENYIEDVLFTINRPAIIYPQTMFRLIRKFFREGKSRDEIERLLVEMQKHNQIKKLYEEEQGK
ncbi:MAG: hypothetical protein AAB071_05470 [Bacteroidota bacterium]